MKADVFPPTPPSELDIPPWVPEAVAHYVRAEYAAQVRAAYEAAIREFEPENDEVADMLAEQDEVRGIYADFVHADLAHITEQYQPLVCDPRMRGVWHELFRRRRNGAFLHPARVPSTADANGRQAAAMVELFGTALACRGKHWDTATRGNFEQQRQHYLARAEQLRGDALTMLAQPLPGRETDISTYERCGELYQALDRAADACEEYACALDRAKGFRLKREHDSSARQLALIISDKFRELFNSPMYGLTATITSVILGHEIMPRMVQQWAQYPADKTSKIAP